MAAVFQLYMDGKGQYRWRLRGHDGQIDAAGPSGYASKPEALADIEEVKHVAPWAPIWEVEEGGGS